MTVKLSIDKFPKYAQDKIKDMAIERQYVKQESDVDRLNEDVRGFLSFLKNRTVINHNRAAKTFNYKRYFVDDSIRGTKEEVLKYFSEKMDKCAEELLKNVNKNDLLDKPSFCINVELFGYDSAALVCEASAGIFETFEEWDARIENIADLEWLEDIVNTTEKKINNDDFESELKKLKAKYGVE